MKPVVKILILAVVVATSILADDFIARGMSVAICGATIVIGYIIGDDTETRKHYSAFLFTTGYLLACTFALLLFLVEVHVDDNGNNATIRSRFYMRTLAVGKLEEHREIPYALRTAYGFVDGIENDDFYFVYNNNKCIICSRYARIMVLELPFTITDKDFGGGSIQLIIDKKGEVFDFHGNPVPMNGDYHPIKVDYTIPDPWP